MSDSEHHEHAQSPAGASSYPEAAGSAADILRFGHLTPIDDSGVVWRVDGLSRRHDGLFYDDSLVHLDNESLRARLPEPWSIEEALAFHQRAGTLRAMLSWSLSDGFERLRFPSDTEMSRSWHLAAALRAAWSTVRYGLYAPREFGNILATTWRNVHSLSIESACSLANWDFLPQNLRGRLPSLPPFHWSRITPLAESTSLDDDALSAAVVSESRAARENNGPAMDIRWAMEIAVVSHRYVMENEQGSSAAAFDATCNAVAGIGYSDLKEYTSGFRHSTWAPLKKLLESRLRPPSVDAPVTFTVEYDAEDNIPAVFCRYVRYIHALAVGGGANGKRLYAPFIPIVQSGGVGKTRLVREVMGLLPTLYICLRHRTSTGLPPRSPVVADHLLENQPGRGRYCVFFLKLVMMYFKTMLRIRTGNDAADLMPFCRSLGHLTFDTGSGGLSSEGALGFQRCADFWEAVVKQNDSLLADFDAAMGAADQSWAGSAAQRNLHEVLRGTSTSEDAVNYAAEGVVARVRAASDALRLGLVPLLVAVDEATALLPSRVSDNPQALQDSHFRDSPFYMLRQVVGERFSSVLVLAALDTSSGLWNLAPSIQFDKSARIYRGQCFLPGPFIRFPMPRRLQLPEWCSGLTDMCQGEGSASFGYCRFAMVTASRPLFHGLLSVGPASDPCAAWITLARTAADKLLYNVDLGVPTTISREAAFALFGARFPVIPFDMHSTQRLVGAHMAMIRDVSGDRAYASVRYVAEPMLAEASARWLNSYSADKGAATGTTPRRSIFSMALSEVCTAIRTGLVAALSTAGDFGEFSACVVLARAFDCANGFRDVYIPNGQPVPASVPAACSPAETAASSCTEVSLPRLPPHAGAPVTLRSFLHSLYGAHWHAAIERRVAQSRNLQRLMAGWVQFLQFIPSEVRGISEDMLWTAWQRRFAYATSPSYPGCDLVIPVLLGPSDGPPMMAAVFIEVKRHAGTYRTADQQRTVAKLLIAARRTLPREPIMLLVMHVGAGYVASRPIACAGADCDERALKAALAGKEPAPCEYGGVYAHDTPDMPVREQLPLYDKWLDGDYSAIVNGDAAGYFSEIARRMSARLKSFQFRPAAGVGSAATAPRVATVRAASPGSGTSSPGSTAGHCEEGSGGASPKRPRSATPLSEASSGTSSTTFADAVSHLSLESSSRLAAGPESKSRASPAQSPTSQQPDPFEDVLLVTSVGCGRVTFGDLMVDVDFGHLRDAAAVPASFARDLDSCEEKFGLTERGMKRLISVSEVGSHLFYPELLQEQWRQASQALAVSPAGAEAEGPPEAPFTASTPGEPVPHGELDTLRDAPIRCVFGPPGSAQRR